MSGRREQFSSVEHVDDAVCRCAVLREYVFSVFVCFTPENQSSDVHLYLHHHENFVPIPASLTRQKAENRTIATKCRVCSVNLCTL